MKKQKKEMKRNAGITLIALVITIIVILILAGASISMLAGDNGILAQAGNVTTTTDIANTYENIKLSLMEYYDNYGRYTKNDVLQAVQDILGDDATISDDNTVTSLKGNTVDISDLINGAVNSWYWSTDSEDEKIITNGTIELYIGDYVNYNEQVSNASSISYTSYASVSGVESMPLYNGMQADDQTFTLSNYEGMTWQILGLDENAGEILLTSSEPIYQDNTINDSNSSEDYYCYFLYGLEGYVNGINELNKICSIFGHGTGATGARSITQDDVDNVLGFDPLTQTGSSLNASWGSGTQYWGYGDTVSIYCNGSFFEWWFEYDDMTLYTGDTFYYLDEDNNLLTVNASDYDTSTFITNITDTTYHYLGTDVAEEDSSEYKLIFGENDFRYWVATNYQSIILNSLGSNGQVFWGLCQVRENYSGNGFAFLEGTSSSGAVVSSGAGVIQNWGKAIRPIVSLDAHIELSLSSNENSWDIE